jgi:lysophospholipase L1-like esterase
MIRTLVLSTVAVLLSTLAATAPAVAEEPAPAGPRLTVVGDSITSWFRDEPGSVSQGWWSMAARDLGASSMTTYAEGGSGMNIRGNNCHGTTFGQRLRSLQTVDYLIVQGGRNDMYTCDVATGTKKALTPAKQKAGIKRYLARLGDRADALGIPRHRVLVMSPWGKSDRARGYKIQAYLRLYSNRNHEGFRYLETKTMPARMTFDNKHPNRDGNLYLASVVERAIRSGA